MSEIIDLDFYRKFKIILHIRGTARQQILKEKTCGMRYQTKHFRRKKKLDVDTVITTKD